VLLPLALLRRRIRLGEVRCEGQHQREAVRGGGDGLAERRIHHDDAARRGGRDIDIVDADAGAADHLEDLRTLENLRRDLGGGADGQAIEAVDGGGQAILVLAQVRLKIHLDAAIPEDLHGGGRERIGDEDSGRHCERPILSGPRRTGRAFGRRAPARPRALSVAVTPPLAGCPWCWRRPNPATALAPRRRRIPPSRRTRCAGPAAHRDSSRCRRRRLPFPAPMPWPWRRRPARRLTTRSPPDPRSGDTPTCSTGSPDRSPGKPPTASAPPNRQ